jgi:hypothetical protein
MKSRLVAGSNMTPRRAAAQYASSAALNASPGIPCHVAGNPLDHLACLSFGGAPLQAWAIHSDPRSLGALCVPPILSSCFDRPRSLLGRGGGVCGSLPLSSGGLAGRSRSEGARDRPRFFAIILVVSFQNFEVARTDSQPSSQSYFPGLQWLSSTNALLKSYVPYRNIP